jgi:hypothetical protein
MPAFGSDGPRRGTDVHAMHLVTWLMRRYRRANKVSRPAEKLLAAVAEALQVLEHAELVQSRKSSEGGFHWSATRLGTEAIASGDVRERIKDRTGL